MLTDSESLFKVIVKSSTATEKRLMVDIQAAWEALETNEISHVGWIGPDHNVADVLTNMKRYEALEKLTDTGKTSAKLRKWTIRKQPNQTEVTMNRDFCLGKHSSEKYKAQIGTNWNLEANTTNERPTTNCTTGSFGADTTRTTEYGDWFWWRANVAFMAESHKWKVGSFHGICLNLSHYHKLCK